MVPQSTSLSLDETETVFILQQCAERRRDMLLNLKLYKVASLAERRARRLGVPSAKRQTVQTNEFVRIW